MMLMIIAMLLILGISLGSFVNALVWRLHQQSLPSKKRAASKADLSIATGRSMCTHCKHTLGPLDLIPLLSWIGLRGKCRYCKQAIGWQYPLVELSTALVFVTSYLYWPLALGGAIEWVVLGLWLASIVGFMALIVYDIRWMLLPNRIVFPLIGIAAASLLLRASTGDVVSVLLAGFGGVAVASGIFYLLFQISGGNWIGGGDVKLGIVLGLLLASPYLGFLMLFIASLMGLAVSGITVLSGNPKAAKRIPFGPSLIIATVICMLFGQIIIDWYSAQFLYI